MQHVELYVNDWTIYRGSVARNALQQLSTLAQARGLITADTPELEVFTV